MIRLGCSWLPALIFLHRRTANNTESNEMKKQQMLKLHGPAWIYSTVFHILISSSVKGEKCKFTGEISAADNCTVWVLRLDLTVLYVFALGLSFLPALASSYMSVYRGSNVCVQMCVITVSASFSSVTLCICSGIVSSFLVEVVPQVKPFLLASYLNRCLSFKTMEGDPLRLHWLSSV